jgi:hypothetical protein
MYLHKHGKIKAEIDELPELDMFKYTLGDKRLDFEACKVGRLSDRKSAYDKLPTKVIHTPTTVSIPATKVDERSSEEYLADLILETQLTFDDISKMLCMINGQTLFILDSFDMENLTDLLLKVNMLETYHLRQEFARLTTKSGISKEDVYNLHPTMEYPFQFNTLEELKALGRND